MSPKNITFDRIFFSSRIWIRSKKFFRPPNEKFSVFYIKKKKTTRRCDLEIRIAGYLTNYTYVYKVCLSLSSHYTTEQSNFRLWNYITKQSILKPHITTHEFSLNLELKRKRKNRWSFFLWPHYLYRTPKRLVIKSNFSPENDEQ